ncbi:MAG: hypothetical protein IAG10_04590 [Planctomycetaceae bacterium]|nr:hypothetical protein [Planctomycetaceae bacterium]
MNWLLRLMVVTSVVSAPLGPMRGHAADSVLPVIPPAPAVANNLEAPAHRLVGVAGCTAASCHGGHSLIGGEASAWLSRDVNHRRAYDVLFNGVARAMAKRLNLKTGAHNEALCLACHSSAREPIANHDDCKKCDDAGQPVAPPAGKPSAIHGDRFAIEFGVGCESCHGAAGDWIKMHTTRTWKSLCAAEKAKWGFRDLQSLSARTETCVACHVGSPAATVDHDLIAAGHPRLAFEMSSYHALLPKHWSSVAEIQDDPGQEVRLWAIGQVASAKAMSDIAAHRAKKAIHKTATIVLPDFAEFDCIACHHDLAELKPGRPTRPSSLGVPRWGSWSVPPTRFLARESQGGAAAHDALKNLVALMDKSRLSAANADELAKTAQQSSDQLRVWLHSLESSRYDAAQATHLLQRVISAETDTDWLPTWDGHTQRYLAASAASQSIQRLTGREPFTRSSGSPALAVFPQRLKYQSGYATPYGFDPSEVDQLLVALRKSLAH